MLYARCALYVAIGFFQPEHGQVGCISCDRLGDFYQELPGQPSCRKCGKNMQRYLGVLSAANRSSCQCKEGGCALSLRALYFRRVALQLMYRVLQAITHS
jgi:hypothetical protein